MTRRELDPELEFVGPDITRALAVLDAVKDAISAGGPSHEASVEILAAFGLNASLMAPFARAYARDEMAKIAEFGGGPVDLGMTMLLDGMMAGIALVLTARDPEDEPIQWYRADGSAICEFCGREYRRHLPDDKEPWLVVLCSGHRVKL